MKYSILKIDDTPKQRGHCGWIRKLSTAGPAELTHLEVHDAEMHYHKKSTEYYYVLNGSGTIKLDDEEIDLKKGDLLTINPGVKHQAKGDLEVLVIAVPPAKEDHYF
jgi:mannose-6-phosphate isomerase-like protein (cupin superfamily)